MKFSSKIQRCDLSPMRKFLPYELAAEAKGRKIYHLNIGQPDIETPKAFFDAVKNFQDPVLAYAAAPGVSEFLTAVQGYYANLGIHLEQSDIYATAGGSEALQMALTCILDEGDEILIPEPFYPNYNTFVSVTGGVIRPIPTTPEEGYRYADRARIEPLINEHTRAILVTNPGNPTGVVLSPEEMRLMADIAKEHGLFLISDEVYREFVYGGEPLASMAQFDDAAENVVVVDSISKRFSACGARVGILVSRNRELMAQALKICQGRLCAATLDQLGKDVPSNRFLYLASTLQKAAADLYYSADRRTDAELCLLRLCDESLCGDLTALENRITRLEDAAARGAAISAAVNQRVSAAKAIGAAPVSQAPAKPASKSVEPPPAEAPPPWDEPPLPEEPPMREEPGERVFDIPEDAISVRPAQPKAVPAKPTASISSAPKPQTAVHSAAPVSGDWWKALSENCKGQIPPMYRAFLDLCGGVLEGDQLTVFAPDEITLNRLDNDRVRGVLSAEAEKVSGQPVRLLLREGEPPKPSPEENLKQLLQFGSQFDNIEIK